MKKILYIVSSLKNTGPMNVLYNIIKYLDRDKYSPCIVELSTTSDNIIEDFKNLEVEIISLNHSRLRGLFQNKSRLLKIMKSANPDFIHTHGFRADVLASKHFRDFPTFSTIHNLPLYDYKHRYGYLKGAVMATLHIEALRNIKHPIGISKSIADDLARKYNISASYIHNGIETQKFKVADIDTIKKIRERLRIPVGKKVFVSVGELSQLKDPLTIIRGFKRSAKKDEAYLVILGAGELNAECRKLAADDNNIDIRGKVNNVPDFLMVSDVFISASLTEGFGLVVIESLACGLSCILSDLAAFREILNHGDNLGVFFKQKEYLQLSKNIDSKISGNIDSISSRHKRHEFVENNFSAEIMSKKYQKLYLLNS